MNAFRVPSRDTDMQGYCTLAETGTIWRAMQRFEPCSSSLAARHDQSFRLHRKGPAGFQRQDVEPKKHTGLRS